MSHPKAQERSKYKIWYNIVFCFIFFSSIYFFLLNLLKNPKEVHNMYPYFMLKKEEEEEKKRRRWDRQTGRPHLHQYERWIKSFSETMLLLMPQLLLLSRNSKLTTPFFFFTPLTHISMYPQRRNHLGWLYQILCKYGAWETCASLAQVWLPAPRLTTTQFQRITCPLPTTPTLSYALEIFQGSW